MAIQVELGGGPADADLPVQAQRDALALLAFALAINLVRIGTKCLWLDEAVTAEFVLTSWSQFTGVIREGVNMSFYYLLMFGWLRLFGDGEIATRLPSAVFGALAVSALYLLARRLFGRAPGLIAGALLALNGFMVEYAQTARSYSLLVLLLTLSSFFFMREVEQPSRSNRVAYVLLSLAAVYAQYYALFVLAAHALSLLGRKRGAALSREWLTVAAAIVVGILPAFALVLMSESRHGISWIDPPIPRDVITVVIDLSGHGRVPALILVGLGAFAVIGAWRERQWWPLGFLVCWFVVPLALGYAVSQVQPMFINRYLIVCLPALLLLGVAGIARLPIPVAGIVVAALLALGARHVVEYYEMGPQEDWREAARSTLASARTGDGVTFFPGNAEIPFEYYVQRQNQTSPPRIRGALDGFERIWIVTRGDEPNDSAEAVELRRALTAQLRVVEQRRFARVVIELWSRGSADARRFFSASPRGIS